MASKGENTEKPSPQRIRKAREKGQFLVSHAFVTAIQFVVATIFIGSVVSVWQSSMAHSLPRLLDRAMSSEIGASEWPQILRGALLENFSPLPLLAATLLTVTLATHLAISKLGFSVQRLMPSFGRLSPMAKLKELPAQNLKSVVEAVLLIAALASVINSLIQENGTAMLQLPLEPIPQSASQVGSSIQSLLWKAAALFVVFGAVDLFRQQRRYMSQLRMSKAELKEENKRTEGDPQMKARIRRLRRDFLRKRMMQDVAKATAVIVNPTHYAVAIRYEMDTMASPMVVAKGKNWVALRIRQIAVQNQIPIIENPPLARALHAAVHVGRAISPEFYKAIAEILAYVYRVMGRTMAA